MPIYRGHNKLKAHLHRVNFMYRSIDIENDRAFNKKIQPGICQLGIYMVRPFIGDT